MKINKNVLQQIIKEELQTIKEMRVPATKSNMLALLGTCGELLSDAADYFARSGQEDDKQLARIYREVFIDVNHMKQSIVDSMKK
jgi:hypothetical protein